jgi:hypothetical protein
VAKLSALKKVFEPETRNNHLKQELAKALNEQQTQHSILGSAS